MEAQQLHFKCEEEPPPSAVLLLYVSDTAAAAIQRDLHRLLINQDGPTNTGVVAGRFMLQLRLQCVDVL